MKEKSEYGPVVFVGLYVAALVLTWLTLFSFERFAVTGVAPWAPFVQAVLSAGAIFSAFALQNRKRAQEKADAQEALATCFVVTSLALEHWAAWFDHKAREGKLTRSLLSRNVVHFGEEVATLRALPIQNIRNSTALARTHLFAIACRQLHTALEEALEVSSSGSLIGKDAFSGRLENLIRRRERMLNAFGEESESERLSPFPHAQKLLADLQEKLLLD